MSTLHSPTVEIDGSALREVPAGAELAFKAFVRCPFGCDLRGGDAEVTQPLGDVISAPLVGFAEGVNESREIRVATPDAIGEHVVKVVLPRQASAVVVHQEASATVTVRTLPHRTSIAVWELPFPAIRGGAFAIKAGVKCAESCDLGGQLIEIRDEHGRSVADAALCHLPEPNTSGLYAAVVRLKAPHDEGLSRWSVDFQSSDLRCSHLPASASFSFRTAALPDYALTVRVVEQATGAPIGGAEVRAGLYRTATGAEGVANLELPKGVYELHVSKHNYAAHAQVLEIDEDVSCEATLSIAPTTDPDDDRIWM